MITRAEILDAKGIVPTLQRVAVYAAGLACDYATDGEDTHEVIGGSEK